MPFVFQARAVRRGRLLQRRRSWQQGIFSWWAGDVLAASAVLVLPILSAWSGEPGKKPAAGRDDAGPLGANGAGKRVGRQGRRPRGPLAQAPEMSPDNAQVHWQLGEVRVQGKWMSPADAAKAAQADRRLAEYVRRRDAAGPIVADQAALARWCRKNRLDDQQRVHWLSVLQRQPDNAEAIQALGLRPYQGMMLTPAQTGNSSRNSEGCVRRRTTGARWWPNGAKRRKTTIRRSPRQCARRSPRSPIRPK